MDFTCRMAAKSGMSFGTTRQRGQPIKETSATRRRIQDVLGQARAQLRQSQQFRNVPNNSKNDSIGNRLQFQQQPQEDYWSTPGGPGGITVTATPTAEKDKYSVASLGQHDTDDTKSRSSYRSNKQNQEDDFGMPFRETLKKSHAALSIPRTPSNHRKLQFAGVVDEISSDASTVTVSLSTNDLRVSSGSEYSTEDESQEGQSVKETLKSGTTHSTKKARKLEEWKVPSAVKITPLNTAVTTQPTEISGEIGVNVEAPAEKVVTEEPNEVTVALPKATMPTATGKVQIDDMGFSRAHIMKSEEDPHWFEKALLTRGETISEAAYNAFKHAQTEQMQQHKTEGDNSVSESTKKGKGKPIFNNLTDPEYTADWMSEAGVTSSMVSEMDMPVSDYIKDDELPGPEVSKAETELEVVSMMDDDDDDNTITESMIRTATELEQSGILAEIAENLQSVLDISDHPESQNFSGMSSEEKTFAKAYDEAMEKADEPLQSIFLDESPGSKGSGKGSLSGTGQDATKTDQRSGPDVVDEEDDYDDTFIQIDSTTSNLTKSASKRGSSKTVKSTSTLISGTAKEKKSTFTVNSSGSGAVTKSSKQYKDKDSPTGSSASGTGKEIASDKSKSKSMSKSKSYASTSSTTSKRINALPIPPDPPTSRHQKNIQNLLEKEVYQKELKKIRSKWVKEEKHQEKMQKVAKESLERNKKGTWKDPDYTEILLPELFKYKSVSGLQAAKAKRSVLTPAINFGAPYFQMNGAISATEGAETMLAAARVESLDIPDLVREVLASNERMYRMTVEASEQMAKKAYKMKNKTK